MGADSFLTGIVVTNPGSYYNFGQVYYENGTTITDWGNYYNLVYNKTFLQSVLYIVNTLSLTNTFNV